MQAGRRAFIIAIAVAVHGLMAAPLPSRMRAHERTSPDSLEEVARWTEALNNMGIGISEEGLMDFSFKAGEVATSTRNFFLKPFRPLFRITGTGQAWGLFTHPDRHPDYLEIYGKGQGGWDLLYKIYDTEHDFMADQLAYRRIRGVWDGSSNRPKASYNYFVDWVARKAFESDPEVQSVRVQFRRTRTFTPSEKSYVVDKVRHRRVRNREDMQ
jgi:hypothetical protein